MPCTSWVFRTVASIGLLVVSVSFLPAADSSGKTSGKAIPAIKDPPGTGRIMDQLRTLFSQWDLNGDGFLDKDELAKDFGYSHAYDYILPPKLASTRTDKATDPDSDKLKDPDSNPSPKTPIKASYANRPDYQFLTQLDQDGDGQLSKDEFMSWARDYAVAAKKMMDYQASIVRAEEKVLHEQNSPAAKKKAENELKKEQKALANLNKKMKSYETHFQQHLKPNPK